ncbi:phage portal protein [Sinorhizobium meliloti]|uniref:phage portal protein n=1 Tax=Rhizobium meliloti TaxID=382 RepID=UPI000FD7B58B|nr:phage portal protein [Sinorhizobium meliloti]RVL87667.1 phage portal protein [Sinorhizobium meliloti]
MSKRTTLSLKTSTAIPPSAPPSQPDKVRHRTMKRGGIRGFVNSVWGAFTGGKTFYQSATSSPKFKTPTDPGPNGANDEHPTLRARSRYAKANFGWYRQAMRQLANNVVGYGISPIIKYPDLKKLYKLWATEADARGKHDINGLQWHVMETVATDGEVLVRFRDRLDGDMFSGVPLQLQLMTADQLPIGETKQLPSGNWVVDGVERNGIDRVVNYWLLPRNPLDWKGSFQSTPQPVRAADICHVFWPETIQSERGAPWGAAILNAMEMLRDYQQSEVEKKALQSKFTVVYSKPETADLDGKGYAGDDEDDVAPNLSAIPAGAAIEVAEGYKADLVDMPTTDSNYEMFNRFSLSEIAVAIGLCVEQITLDFSNINDRVYRAMMLEVARFIQSIQFHMMVAQFLQPTWKRFVAEAIRAKKWIPPEGARPEDYMIVEWMPPAKGHIHPIQEVQAFMMAVQAGFTSRSKVAAEFGYDIEEIDLENASDSQRAQIEGIAYTVYDGWKDQPITPEMLEIRKQQQAAVIDAIQKMAEQDMDIAA